MRIISIEVTDDHGNPQQIRVGDIYDFGNKKVIEIEQHAAQGEGDKWYWNVKYNNGDEEMIFNVNRVYKNK